MLFDLATLLYIPSDKAKKQKTYVLHQEQAPRAKSPDLNLALYSPLTIGRLHSIPSVQSAKPHVPRAVDGDDGPRGCRGASGGDLEGCSQTAYTWSSVVPKNPELFCRGDQDDCVPDVFSWAALCRMPAGVTKRPQKAQTTEPPLFRQLTRNDIPDIM
jgi:hypothetical protein